ncbi:hypothetical protein [Phormidium nigroviride]
MMMNQSDILEQIYRVITTAPEILTPPFIEQLLIQVLPLAESDADNDTLEDAINALYRHFKDDREKIKALYRKSLDSAQPEKNSDYPRLTNDDDVIKKLKKLEASLQKRLNKN